MVRFLDIRKITGSFQPELGDVVARVAASGDYIRGAEGRAFEEAYAAYTGSAHCVGVGNGFDALRLILRSWILLGAMNEGDEVIVPANTYIASILAVMENRLTPVLAEPCAGTFIPDAASIEEKISPRTKAIMVVHLYGVNAMQAGIRQVAEKYRLKVLEDNAQAAGCCWGPRRTGSLGDAAAHSFFPTKNLGSLGDAGAVTTNDAALAGAVRALGNYGSSKRGVNTLPGVNSRLDELQAAILSLKLRRLDADNDARRIAAAYYSTHIINPSVTVPQPPPAGKTNEHVWHLYVIRCTHRDALQRYLARQGVETLVHYPVPPHRQEACKAMNHLSFPVSEQLHREVLSLPLSPVMDKNELERVVKVLNDFRVGDGED